MYRHTIHGHIQDYAEGLTFNSAQDIASFKNCIITSAYIPNIDDVKIHISGDEVELHLITTVKGKLVDGKLAIGN